MFNVGFAKTTLTPSMPVVLGGYAARTHPSTGVHDDIYAKAFYISDGKTETVIVSCDLVAIPQDLFVEIKNQCAETYSIENLIISATHNHSGPDTRLRSKDSINSPWRSELPGKIINIIGEAIKNSEPMSLYAGFGPVEGMAKNRRSGETEIDDNLMVISAYDQSGEIKLFIINYACHCTVLDANNYLITADYPAFLYNKLATEYKGAEVIFINGACGNINIGYSADASALGVDMGDIRTYANAERKADILFQKVKELLAVSTELEPKINFIRKKLELPIKDNLPEAAELEKRISEKNDRQKHCIQEAEKAKLEISKIYDQCILDNLLEYDIEGSKFITSESVLLSIGDVMLITVPVELFCEIGKTIKSKFDNRWRSAILGYSNGFFGYLPTKKAQLAGGYECETSVHHIDSETYLGKVMAEAANELLRLF
jgi:hypothetical protein